MKGVTRVRPASSPGILYMQMGVAIAVMLAAFALAASFLNPAMAKTALHAAMIRGLQNAALYLFLRPVALHPFWAVGFAAMLAYLPSAYAVAGPRFKTPILRYHALYSVPPGAAVTALVIFATLEAVGLLDDHGRKYYAAAVSLGALATAVAAGYAWRAIQHEPRTVQEIADNPRVFDLEDLEGIAMSTELWPKGDDKGLLLPLGDVPWPNPENSALADVLRDRIVLGRYCDHRKERTQLWVAPQIRNLKDTLVVAPPGSGKTFSIALPLSLELPQKGQSVFSVDVKGNMYDKMKAIFGEVNKTRQKKGQKQLPLLYFDVTPNVKDSLSWNPFDQLIAGGLTGAKRLQFAIGRDRLAEAIFGPISGGETQHWDLIDLRVIKSGIELLCYINQKAHLEIIKVLSDEKVSLPSDLKDDMVKEITTGIQRLSKEPECIGPPTLRALHDLFLSRDSIVAYFEVLDALLQFARARYERDRHSDRNHTVVLKDTHIFHTLRSHLRGLYEEEELKKRSFSERIEGVRNRMDPFGHAAVWEVTNKSSFNLDTIADEPGLFICSAPMNLGLVGSSMAALMVRMIQHVMTGRFKSKAGATDKRLFLILDEFSKLKMGAEQTADFISTSREAGCVSVIFLQDVSQIREEVRQPILANCRDKYFLRGAGVDTAAWCSKALGSRRVPKASLSDSATTATRGQSTGLSASISEDQAPVLREREIQTTGGLKYGAWMVLDHYSHKPILVDLDRSRGQVKQSSKHRRWWNVLP